MKKTTHNRKEKHSVIIQTVMEYRHCVCVRPGTRLENVCWVHLGSSTWNVLWLWNNKERRLRLLEKIIEEGSIAVDCIALNNWGKHKRKMIIRGINWQESNQQQ